MHLVAAMPTEAIGGSLGQSLKWILTLKVRPSRPVVVCSATELSGCDRGHGLMIAR